MSKHEGCTLHMTCLCLLCHLCRVLCMQHLEKVKTCVAPKRQLLGFAGSLFALEVLHRSGMQFYEVGFALPHVCHLYIDLLKLGCQEGCCQQWLACTIQQAYITQLPLCVHSDSNLRCGHGCLVSGGVPCTVRHSFWGYLGFLRSDATFSCGLSTCLVR